MVWFLWHGFFNSILPDWAYRMIIQATYYPLLKYEQSGVADWRCSRIPFARNGNLWLSMMPTVEDLERVARAGVKGVISCNEDWEIEWACPLEGEAKKAARLWIQKECERLGMEHVQAPMPDRGVLAPPELLALGRRAAEMHQKGGVLIHCRFGKGRSVTVCALAMAILDKNVGSHLALKILAQESPRPQAVGPNQEFALHEAYQLHLDGRC